MAAHDLVIRGGTVIDGTGSPARTADVAMDRLSVTFDLRREAKFADGTALTGEDVCDSFRLLSSLGHERIRLEIKDVKACEVLSASQVLYRFNGENIRDLPLTVAQLPIFSKAFYSSIVFKNGRFKSILHGFIPKDFLLLMCIGVNTNSYFFNS